MSSPGLVETRPEAKPRRDFRFVPSVGRWSIELARLARAIASSPEDTLAKIDAEIDAFVDQLRTPSPRPASDSRLRFVFGLSLLYDIVRAGGTVKVFDSEMYVAWPDWNDGVTGRVTAQQALSSLADQRAPNDAERRRLSHLFAPSLSTAELRSFLEEGRFRLVTSDATHPSGVRYGEAFGLAIRSWNMPYRGRQGRNRRFIVVGESRAAADPVVVGLIEVGDEAPYSLERDQFLSLRPAQFLAWLAAHPDQSNVANTISRRLRSLRVGLLPIAGTSTSADAEQILALGPELIARAHGRSRSSEDFQTKKRIAYLLRLAKGEIAFGKFARGESLNDQDPLLREGVRAVHDLSVPRIHMEVTVCGAVPPFNQALGGKLAVAFLAHPSILDVTISEPGAIVQGLFAIEQVSSLLPGSGLLALTTKGLYPSHSALYNRASVPGRYGEVRLARIGKTRGTTTTFLGDRSARLAERITNAVASERQVSMTYGTGGAKRQRLLEGAVISIGLPESFVHAGIRRPVYGLRFARNIEGIVWAGEEPEWVIDRTADPAAYSKRATVLWRDKWLRRAEDRLLLRPGLLPGLLETLSMSSEP